MKITNPTVFLDNGELKCLTVEVPEMPNVKIHPERIPHWATCMDVAKSSAVRVKDEHEIKLRIAWNNGIKSDTLYTLTGYEATIFGLHPNESYAMIATISPAVKAESQEVNELIQKVHEDMEGRYDLTGEDLYFIHAALCDLAQLKRKK